MFYCTVICGNIQHVHENENFENHNVILKPTTDKLKILKLQKGYHSVRGTGHGFGGSQGSTDCVPETIIFRYGQAIPTHVITLY